MSDIDWDDIRDEDREQDRWEDDEEPEERAPDDVVRRDDVAAINDWLRRR